MERCRSAFTFGIPSFWTPSSPNDALRTCTSSIHHRLSSSSFVPVCFQANNNAAMLTMSVAPSELPYSVPQHADTADHNGCEVRTTKGRGEGVFAMLAFRRGEVVVEGIVVAELTANHSHATQVALDRFIQHGGINSIVNHNCDPNCGIKLNAAGGNDIVAMRTIEVGEEITFDYAMRNFSIQHFPKQCLCGAVQCRKTVTGYKDLPTSFKTKYEGFIAPYLLELNELSRNKRDT